MPDQMYDPRDRDQEKQRSREKDELALARGIVSAADLRRINSFIPPDVARLSNVVAWKEME